MDDYDGEDKPGDQFVLGLTEMLRRGEEGRGDGRARVLPTVLREWMTFTGSMRIQKLSCFQIGGATKTAKLEGRRGEVMGGGRRKI